jgi:two-component system, NtrC family, response regulator PilR
MSQEALAKLREVMKNIVQPSVLVVEDDPNDVLLLQNALDRFGVVSTQVRHAEEAKALLRQRSYTLCLLDLKLPDASDPVELVNSLTKINPLTPVAVVTGSLHDETLRQILEQKVLAVWLKPITVEKLRDVFDHER